MADIFSSTVIFSVHHRKSPLFEEGMEKLYDIGFKRIWICETGLDTWGVYRGPYEQYIDMRISNYTYALLEMHGRNLPKEIERIILIDNDCFISDPKDTIEYVQAFIDGGYDCVAVPGPGKIPVCNNKDIIRQIDPSFLIKPKAPGQDIPYHTLFITEPAGSCYAIFSRQSWLSLKNDPLQFTLKIWEDFSKTNMKFGLRRGDIYPIHPSCPGTYCSGEKGKWFHIGNLMCSYFALEDNRLPPDDLRIGYFCKYFPFTMLKILRGDIGRFEKYIKQWEDFTGIV